MRSRPGWVDPIGSRWTLAVLALLGSSLATGRAHAYCRTTTCDQKHVRPPDEWCVLDQVDCATNGLPLYWPQACVAFSVQKDGSPLRNITFDTMKQVMERVYERWEHVDCGNGESPAIEIFDRSPVNCDQAEFNDAFDTLNANIWMFRDAAWPHDDATALALTTVTFDPNTGEILDADVEIDSAYFEITGPDQPVGTDLQSIVQHESGHTFGLGESWAMTLAVMYGEYSDPPNRILDPDDIAGICAIYPPGQDRGACDPTPRHGFSGECDATFRLGGGCSCATPARGSTHGVAGLCLGLLGTLLLRHGRRR